MTYKFLKDFIAHKNEELTEETKQQNSDDELVSMISKQKEAELDNINLDECLDTDSINVMLYKVLPVLKDGEITDACWLIDKDKDYHVFILTPDYITCDFETSPATFETDNEADALKFFESLEPVADESEDLVEGVGLDTVSIFYDDIPVTVVDTVYSDGDYTDHVDHVEWKYEVDRDWVEEDLLQIHENKKDPKLEKLFTEADKDADPYEIISKNFDAFFNTYEDDLKAKYQEAAEREAQENYSEASEPEYADDFSMMFDEYPEDQDLD